MRLARSVLAVILTMLTVSICCLTVCDHIHSLQQILLCHFIHRQVRMSVDECKIAWLALQAISIIWEKEQLFQVSITSMLTHQTRGADPVSIQCCDADSTFIPANKKRWTNAGLMLEHHLWHQPNIKPTMVQRLLFAGNAPLGYISC